MKHRNKRAKESYSWLLVEGHAEFSDSGRSDMIGSGQDTCESTSRVPCAVPRVVVPPATYGDF